MNNQNTAANLHIASSAFEAIANDINSIYSTPTVINYDSIINLDPDQVITIGNSEIYAKELLWISDLLKETYPERYI